MLYYYYSLFDLFNDKNTLFGDKKISTIEYLYLNAKEYVKYNTVLLNKYYMFIYI